jgi:electron transfer flavoprotein alpha subunit
MLVHGLRELQATHLVAASTLLGRSVLPRAAALLDLMPLSEIVAIVDAHTFERPVHAGAAIARLRSDDPVHVIGLRGSAFAPPATRAGAPAPIERINWPAHTVASATVVERRVQAGEGLPSLSGARIVVSGGRGVGSAEGYAQLQPLARSLGAALGASRAAVDSGFAEASQQVGQTGQSVAPDLYLAMGISGAVQHWAGMKDSKLIVAVNKDPEAPIFQFADLGLVADLFEVLPELEAGLPGRLRAAQTGQA